MTQHSDRLLSSPPCASGDGRRQGVRLGLHHIEELAARFGHPQLEVPIVLVAGTNGKGSTSSLLSTMLTHAGYRTGLFTSPHLESFHERLTIDGRPISEATFTSILRRIHHRSENDPPTVFEALTLAAWLFFHEQEVDIAIMEVGLGGRLDATNACEPILAIITSIAFDHTEYLGDSIEQIASEKMGIARTGKPLVCALSSNRAGAFISEQCSLRNIPLIDADQTQLDEGLTLPDGHQLTNLELAVTAAHQLQSSSFPRLDQQAIKTGLANWRWPGRYEWRISTQQQPVLFDVAHNPAAAKHLANYVARHSRSFVLVFGALADKDVNGMLEVLRPAVAHTILTKPSNPRSFEPEDVPTAPNQQVISDPTHAYQHAISLARDRAILVCGSHSVVGEIRSLLSRT